MFKLSFICTYGKYVFITCSLSMWSYVGWTHENLTHVTILNLQSITVMLWIRLAIARDLVPSLRAPVSLLPLPLKRYKFLWDSSAIPNTPLILQGHRVWTGAIVPSVNICQTNMNSIPSSDVKMLDNAYLFIILPGLSGQTSCQLFEF